MKSKVGKNYIFNLSYQILVIILPLITTPYISRVLGAKGVGIYNYTFSIVTAFTLIAVLGTNSYAIREIAYVQGKKDECTKLFYEIVFLRLITTVLLLPIYFIIAMENASYKIIYLALSTYLISVPLDISWFFQGLEDFKKTVIRSLIVRIIGVILIFTFVNDSGDVALYGLIMGGSGLIGNVLLWIYLPKYIGKLDVKHFTPFRHFKSVLVFFVPALSTYIYTSLDKIVLGTFSTEVEVGYYSQSEKIVKLLITVITSLATVLMPRIANLIKNGRLDEVENNINRSYQFVLFIGMPMMGGLAAITPYFVPLFLGKGYDKCISLMYILIPLIIIMGLASMTGTTVMIAMGQQKKYNIIIISASIINFVLNILLVRVANSYGVAIATIIAEGFVTVTEILSIKELIQFRNLLSNAIKYGAVTVLMTMSLWIVKNNLPCAWGTIIIMVCGGVIEYSLCLLALRDTMLKYIFNMVFGIFRNRNIK